LQWRGWGSSDGNSPPVGHLCAAGHCHYIRLTPINPKDNRGTKDVIFIEVQIGSILDEVDIERLDDTYGRA